MDTSHWVVNLGDGTWVVLDELPTVMYITDEEEAEWEKVGEADSDCVKYDHIHIKELVENSHWNDDHSDVSASNTKTKEE